MIKNQHGSYHPAQLGIVLGLIVIAIGWFAYNYITKDTEISCNDLKAMTLIINDASETIQEIHDINCQSIPNKENKIKITGEEFDKIKESTSELDIKAPYVLEKYSKNKKISEFKIKISELVKKGVFHKTIIEYASLNKEAMDDILLDPESSFFKVRSKNLSISKEVLPRGLLATYINHCNDDKDDCIILLKEITEKQNPGKEIFARDVEGIAPNELIKNQEISFTYPSNDQCYLFFSKSRVVEKNNKCAIAIPNNNNYYLYLIREKLPLK